MSQHQQHTRTGSPHAQYHGLAALARDILLILSDGGKSGVEVRDHLEDYHATTIKRGGVYAALQRLEQRGLVSVGSRDSRTNEYSLTQDGGRVVLAGLTYKDEHTPGGWL